MTTIRLRVATKNVPESLKRGLLKDRGNRAKRVAGLFQRRRIDVAATQESGTYLAQADEDRSAIKTLWAAANDYVRGRRVGNGVIVKHRRWKSRLLDDVTIGEGDDAVNIAVVQLTERNVRGRDPFRFKLYAVHKPTRRATNKNLRPVIDAKLRDLVRFDDENDRPWVVAGDFNGPISLPGGVVLADHGVDSIVASRRYFEPLGQTVVDRPLLSDHAFLIADVMVEV